jgi:hypothetical protein
MRVRMAFERRFKYPELPVRASGFSGGLRLYEAMLVRVIFWSDCLV